MLGGVESRIPHLWGRALHFMTIITLYRRFYNANHHTFGQCQKKGNTSTVLGWVEDEFESLGHDVGRIYLNNKLINGCLGYAKCRENPDEIACVQKDDANGIIEQMI